MAAGTAKQRRKSAVVVGGGIAGLLSASMLKSRYASVTLVERDEVCGGLFTSIANDEGVEFDFGTHLLSDTGLPELDAILYGWTDPRQWHVFQVIKTGNYFRGRMNRTSSFVDARCLDETEFRSGMAELLATKPFRQEDCADLKAYLERHFGPTFARAICAPMLKKHLGVSLEDLHPATPFALQRLVCADAEESRRFKEDPFLDKKIAFASYDEGAKTIDHRYPRTGGIGQWVRGFAGKTAEAGVEIITGQMVTRVHLEGGDAIGVTLSNGRRVDCDVLVWTIPPFMLLRAAGIGTRSAAVVHRPIGLFHLVFDRPFLDANYYVTCYDEDPCLFRVTLYPNVRGGSNQPPYNCTVEVIAEAESDFTLFKSAVLEELVRIGIVDRAARLLYSDLRVVPAGFPATTHSFMSAAAEQAEQAAAHIGNALLLGRAKCPPFFTTDVLLEAYRRIENVCRD